MLQQLPDAGETRCRLDDVPDGTPGDDFELAQAVSNARSPIEA
jgi:hypothetical protein